MVLLSNQLYFPVAERLIHALRMQARRGKIAIAGK
jgi:hypothetical protein